MKNKNNFLKQQILHVFQFKKKKFFLLFEEEHLVLIMLTNKLYLKRDP